MISPTIQTFKKYWQVSAPFATKKSGFPFKLRVTSIKINESWTPYDVTGMRTNRVSPTIQDKINNQD